MNPERIKKVQKLIADNGYDVIICTDMSSISYLIDVAPSHMMERLFALAVPRSGKPKLFVNSLYRIPESENYDVEYHSDDDIPTSGLAGYISGTKVGVDKFMMAKFLLALMDERKDVEFSIGSFIIDEARMIKDKDEIEAMRYASRVNDMIFAPIPGMLEEGMTETELADKLAREYVRLGDPDNPPEPLVCFGEGSAEPHHTNSNRKLRSGDVVLVDSGQRTFGYFSDTTRTFFFRSITEEQEKVYRIVREANRLAREAIRPGARFCDIDRAARDYIASQGYGEFFTHRLGHCIGRDDHEEPSVALNNDAVIRPGTCFSVEPGIYLHGRFGVRVEDVILVTEYGYEQLVHASKDIIVVK